MAYLTKGQIITLKSNAGLLDQFNKNIPTLSKEKAPFVMTMHAPLHKSEITLIEVNNEKLEYLHYSPTLTTLESHFFHIEREVWLEGILRQTKSS